MISRVPILEGWEEMHGGLFWGAKQQLYEGGRWANLLQADQTTVGRLT